MTSPDQQGQPLEDHQSHQEGQQPTGRSSWSRYQSRSPGSRQRGVRLWTVLSVVALVALGGVLLSLTIGGTNQTAANASSGSSTSAGTTNTAVVGSNVPRGTGTAKGNVISAAKLAENGGALSLPTGNQAQVTSWQSGAGGHDLTAVSSQLGDALQAGGVRQYVSMKYACTQLAGSVTTAQAAPAIPDVVMQTLYAKALGELAKGAADCRAAISAKPDGDESDQAHVDTTTLNQSVSELSIAATDLFRSTAEIEIASRQNK